MDKALQFVFLNWRTAENQNFARKSFWSAPAERGMTVGAYYVMGPFRSILLVVRTLRASNPVHPVTP